MKKLRYLTALLCIALAALMLSGCEKTSSQIEAEKQAEIKAENVADVQAYTQKNFADNMKNETFETFQKYLEEGNIAVSPVFDNDWANRWNQFTEAHGAVKDAVVDLTQRTAEGGYTSRIILTGEDDAMMAMTIAFTDTMAPVSTSISDYSNDADETLGSKMSTAAGNTITGLLVVFCILIGLSLIISCFKFVNKIGGEVKPENKDKKKAAPAAAPAARAAAPAPTSAELDLARNQELVAVIAAAIAAATDSPVALSGDAPVDGYVVRSIRRLHNNKWH
jgi:Na+-transporting methylmalonyl-CoA/oxaloacetate decarboxylase gamma subunit